jgi:NTP pyrophosphatase (non-canonical NTP hydrolase)
VNAPPLTFAGAQAAVTANKLRQGFSTTDVEAEFGFLLEEAGEAHNAWRRHRAPRPSRARRLLARLRVRPLPPPLARPAPVRDEIADVLLFMLGIDAGQAVAEKIRVNAQRTYRTMPNGTRVKNGAALPRPPGRIITAVNRHLPTGTGGHPSAQGILLLPDEVQEYAAAPASPGPGCEAIAQIIRPGRRAAVCAPRRPGALMAAPRAQAADRAPGR